MDAQRCQRPVISRLIQPGHGAGQIPHRTRQSFPMGSSMEQRGIANPRALAVAAVLLLATVATLRIEGRIWWCACRTPTPYSTDVTSPHNSQHLLDAYSFSHLLHGIIFYWCLRLLAPRVSPAWMLVIALTIEAGWEVLENSPLVIARYRAATAAQGYSGDSIVNSAGDVLSCALG